MWQSRTDELGLLCTEVQMTYESEHIRIGNWHRKTKHMNKNLSNVTVQHTSIMKSSGIESRVQVYVKIWHDTCSEANTII